MATIRIKGSGTLTSDGDTDTVVVSGPCAVSASGTWGSGTLTFYQYRNGGWEAITDDGTDVAFTADNDTIIDARGVTQIKGTLAGSTSPSIKWEIRGN